MKKFKYFENRECEYYPCHVKSQNCLFCYCPLYWIPIECEGNYKILKNGIKDCCDCTKPHDFNGWDFIQRKLTEVFNLKSGGVKMADFNEAFNHTMGHEGGYVNDPDDAGGETYRGIARVYNPQWSGWDIIDDTKPNIDNIALDFHVRKFYEERYWDVNRLDDFPQSIANEMFDTGVNMGIGRAAKFLQECLNYLNRNGSLFADLVVDGAIGPASLNALSKVTRDEEILLTMLNVCQGRHYMNYMSKSPTQEKYARGWFKRVKLTKE